MPIAALPPSTAQAIGSTSILPDPCAVVKELVDNGLDAGANSISVEISPNTLDVIKVKDNGYGISPEDFDCMCKRAYTSKIQTLDDLRNIGGQSLGFRGVALASAADMAEVLTVTTRTKNEVVASVLKYGRNGQLVSTEKASHAVGTTVCLTGFLKSIPVRRQTTVKTASKSIAKLKKLLQTYAIARPGTRLSFKVLNGKNDKDNWTYAPSSTANITDASCKVVGVESAGQCIRKSWPEDFGEESAAPFRLFAYLPKADGDFSKIGNSGQYISVDGRPLSSARGTAKDIIRIYKSHIRSAMKVNGTATLSEPFLCLQISCPRGSYDANVEPAKDDVLFAERDELIKLAEELFKAVYGESRTDSVPTEKPSASGTGFNLLLRQPATQEPVSPPSTNPLPNATNVSRPAGGLVETPQASVQISTRDDEMISDEGNGEEVSDGNCINPWSIAKTHFFNRTPKSTRGNQLITPTRLSFRRPTAGRCAEATHSSPSDISSPYSQPSSPENGGLFPDRPSLASTRGPHSSNSFTRASRERDKELYGNGSLDTWFTKNIGPTIPNMLRIEQSEDQFETESIMLDDFDTDDLAEQSNGVSKPFKSPLPQETRDTLNRSQRILQSPNVRSANGQSMDNRQGLSVMKEWPLHPSQTSPICEHSQNNQETEIALDFERRKREANLAYRKQLLHTPVGSQSSSKSPHNNRFLAAKAALSQHGPQNQPISLHQNGPLPSSADQVSTKENDPRAYLIRHQSEIQKQTAMSRENDGTTKAAKRIPTSRLPLEKIPSGFDIHNVGLSLHTPLPWKHLTTQCKHIAEVDFYVSGKNEDINCHPFNTLQDSDLSDICKTWEATVVSLIKQKYRLKEVDLCDTAGGSDEALLESIDIYAAINAMQSS